jgi:hypothetical protein
VFYTSSPFGSEKIEPETVLSGVSFRHQTGSEHNPLRRIYDTLEDGVLHPLSKSFPRIPLSAQEQTSAPYYSQLRDSNYPATYGDTRRAAAPVGGPQGYKPLRFFPLIAFPAVPLREARRRPQILD